MIELDMVVFVILGLCAIAGIFIGQKVNATLFGE